jgi:hypothetical protein
MPARQFEFLRSSQPAIPQTAVVAVYCTTAFKPVGGAGGCAVDGLLEN